LPLFEGERNESGSGHFAYPGPRESVGAREGENSRLDGTSVSWEFVMVIGS
jgi:hypothetical protein